MLSCLVVLPDGRSGSAEIDINCTFKRIKETILEDIGVLNPDSYTISIYPASEDVKVGKLFDNRVTLKISKRFHLEEDSLNGKR